MDKKYQVFVSSTYEDLKEERAAVITALLKNDYIPVCMEYFTASNKTQWEVIENIIPQCDYYVVIVAGKYGSIDESTGLSYTQKEYELAVSKDIPCLGFVRRDINSLPGTKLESDDTSKQKLKEFTKDVKNRMCEIWSNKDDLAARVISALHKTNKENPRSGWIRADENLELINELQSEIDSLKDKLRVATREDITEEKELHNRNLILIKNLMSHFSTNLMDRYLSEGPMYIHSKMFDSNDYWKGVIHASSFVIYDQDLKSKLMPFFTTWTELMSHGEWYSPSEPYNNTYRFNGLKHDIFGNDTDEKNFHFLTTKVVELAPLYKTFVEYVKDNCKLDLSSLSYKFETN